MWPQSSGAEVRGARLLQRVQRAPHSASTDQGREICADSRDLAWRMGMGRRHSRTLRERASGTCADARRPWSGSGTAEKGWVEAKWHSSGTLTGSLPDQRCATIFPWRTHWVLSELTSHHRDGALPCRVCSIPASAPRMYASKASTVEGFNCTGLTVCTMRMRPTLDRDTCMSVLSRELAELVTVGNTPCHKEQDRT